MKTLFLLILSVFLLTSCASYKRCQVKFATTLTDSVKVNVPVSVIVPRDSVVTSFKTDTTYLYKEIQQGRAKIIVERTHTITTVQARCDSVIITKTIRVKVPGPQVVWGVKPAFKTYFKICLNLLILSVGANIIQFINNRKRKRKDGLSGTKN